MFRSLPDHHQGFQAFLVKVTGLICDYSCVVMRQHDVQCTNVMFGEVRCADCTVIVVFKMRICRDAISNNRFIPQASASHHQNIVISDSLLRFVVCTEVYIHEPKNIGISLAHAPTVHGHHIAVLHLGWRSKGYICE
jgi:hypothetical protein